VHVRGMGGPSVAKGRHTSTSHISLSLQSILFPVFVRQSDRAETGFNVKGVVGLPSSIWDGFLAQAKFMIQI
jgi:hypothetical protein